VTSALSFAEELVWYAGTTDRRSVPFLDCWGTLSTAIRLDGERGRRMFVEGLAEALRRHEVLRSRYLEGAAGPVRQGHPASAPAIEQIELSDIDAADHARLADALGARTKRSFDLAATPIRAQVAITRDGLSWGIVTMHHIVCDIWSRQVLRRELLAAVHQGSAGGTVSLPALTAGYDDYVEGQHRLVGSPRGDSLLDYWTATLRELVDLELPCDGDRAHRTATQSAIYRFTIAHNDRLRITSVGRRHKVTLATMLLAIFTLELHTLTDCDDIAVGIPIADRSVAEYEGLVGLLSNAVVVRTRMTRQSTIRDVIDQVRAVFTEAMRHQELPYGYLVGQRDSETPPCRVLFNFAADMPGSDTGSDEVFIDARNLDTDAMSIADLSLRVHVTASRELSCAIVYKARLYSEARIQAIASRFRSLVASVPDRLDWSIHAAARQCGDM
jgi:hypothetical protein